LMCWICWHPRVRLKFYVRLFFMIWLTPFKLTLKKNDLCRIFLLPENWLKFDDEKKVFWNLRNFQVSWNDWNSFH
jgi:hypothetical protein